MLMQTTDAEIQRLVSAAATRIRALGVEKTYIRNALYDVVLKISVADHPSFVPPLCDELERLAGALRKNSKDAGEYWNG